MSKKNIMVISGGISNERDVSINSGKNVFDNLDRAKYNATLVDVTKELVFAVIDSDDKSKIGTSIDIYSTTTGVNNHISSEYDLVFNALHGEFGEDGKVQSLLDIAGLRYTHSSVVSSAIGMDKVLTSMLVSEEGFRTPNTVEFLSNGDIKSNMQKIASSINYPIFIKPNSSGSSQGIYNKVIEENELFETLIEASRQPFATEMLAQECIVGRELTCPVVGNKNSHIEVMPVGEIITGAEFFDYNAKYFDATTEEIFPADISQDEEKLIQSIAITAHQVIGCDGLTRSDFILTEEGEVFFIETNTNPGLANSSLTPKAAKAIGLSYSDLLDLMIDKAFEKPHKK